MGKEDAGKKVFGGFEGLAKSWDNSERLRARLHDVQRLVVTVPAEDDKEQAPANVVPKTVANLRYNHHAMRPLVRLMSPHQDCVPCLTALTNELRIFFGKGSLNPSQATLQDQAWSLRYLFSVLKQQTYRSKPPKDEVLTQLLKDYGVNVEEWPQRGRGATPSMSPEAEAARPAARHADPRQLAGAALPAAAPAAGAEPARAQPPAGRAAETAAEAAAEACQINL